MVLFLLMLLLFIALMLLFVSAGPLIFLIIFPAVFLILVLLLPRRFMAADIMMGSMLLLITLKPVVDLFWDTYLAGFKLLHYYSLVMYLYAVFLLVLRRVRLSDFRFYHLALISGVYYTVLAVLYFAAKGNFISTMEYFLRTTYGIPFFFLMGSYLENEGRLERFLWLTVVMLVPIALMGLYFLITGSAEGFQITGAGEKFWRLKGLYHDASVFGLKMVPALVASWYLALRKYRWMNVLVLVLALLIFYTYTRALWIFLSIFFGLWAIYRRNYWIIVILLFLIFLKWDFIVERFTYAGITLESPYGFGGRVIRWRYGLEMFYSAPVFSKLFGLFVAGIVIPGGYIHNLYLQWLLDGGLIGFGINATIFAVFLLSVMRMASKGSARAFLALHYMLFLLVTGFAASYMNVPNVQVYLWSFLGMVFYSPLKLVHGSKGFEAGDSNGLWQHHHESHPHRKEG